jgi:tRNA pseudouridine38-40 synthase
MARFRLALEYEGTRYSGWQVQKNARTVQGELIGAAKTVFGTQSFELYGAGRTDAGVHALRQIAHLDISTMLAPEIICRKMNDELPGDIAIHAVDKAHPNFHARHDAIARSYLYQISRRRTAFGKKMVWWIKDKLNDKAMAQAAAHFIGMHDFRSFTADDPEEKSMKAQILDCRIIPHGDLILLHITGSHFLWNMVRRITGMLAEIGRGKFRPEIIPELLHSHSDMPAQYTAPPSGLFLARIHYKQAEIEQYSPKPVLYL